MKWIINKILLLLNVISTFVIAYNEDKLKCHIYQKLILQNEICECKENDINK